MNPIASPKAMTQRKIQIRSELMLQRPIAAYHSDKILWINIRSPLADHSLKLCRPLEELPPEWKLSLRFDDIRAKVQPDNAWTLFDVATACKVAKFIDQDWDILLINCEAGVSALKNLYKSIYRQEVSGQTSLSRGVPAQRARVPSTR